MFESLRGIDLCGATTCSKRWCRGFKSGRKFEISHFFSVLPKTANSALEMNWSADVQRFSN